MIPEVKLCRKFWFKRKRDEPKNKSHMNLFNFSKKGVRNQANLPKLQKLLSDVDVASKWLTKLVKT